MAMPSKAPEQFGFREAKILENGSNTENSPRKKDMFLHNKALGIR